MWALWNTCKVHMNNQLKVTNIEFYSDETALVTVENEGVIEVQGFLIEFGDLPCQGSVEFEIDRLDLW